MNAGSITISTELDNKELETQYAATIKKIRSLTDKINAAQAKRSPAADQSAAIAAELDAAKAQLDYMKSGQEFFTAGAIQQQEASVKSIQKDWDRTQVAVEKYDAQISAASTELSANEEKAGAIASEMAAAGRNTSLMGDSLDAVGIRLNKIFTRIQKLATRILFFSVITMGLRSMREWLSKIIKVNKNASAAVSQLKAALLTLAQPLVNVITPAFTQFVQLLTQIVMAVSQVFSSLSGTTVEESEKSAEALNGETSALDDAGKAAKKAAKSLASFDEINQLSGKDDEQTTSATDVDFSGLQKFSTDDYKNKIAEITAVVSGALLALGAILFFSGANPALGLGLMAAGAVGLVAVAKENWGWANAKVTNAISTALAITSGVLLGLGAVLCFSGANVPLGIGLLAAGAVGLAASIGLNWNTTTDHVKSIIATLEFVVGGALLALGAMLLFTGANIPLGIALISAGAVSIAAAAALNWDAMPEKVKSVITVLTAAVGGALLALGALLLFTGVSVPLGIAFLAAGAVSLAAAVTLNWDSTTGKVKNAIQIITGVVSGALLCVGALLAFGGVNIPLGIGLMIAGGIGLAAASGLNWNELPEKVKTAVQAVLAAVAGLGVAILTIKLLGNSLGFAAIAAGVLAAGIIYLSQNWSQLNGAEKAATILVALAAAATAAAVAIAIFHTAWSVGIAAAAIAGGLALLGLTFAFTKNKSASSMPTFGNSFDFSKSLNLPKLATGAVIPPNREFMAVLGDQKSGTNIEAPVSEIEAAVARGIAASGGASGRNSGDIILQIDGKAFARITNPYYANEQRRVGMKLVGGAT